MGLFPSEAEVRRRRRDRSMAAMLYTEPDDYSEPRGTNEEKRTGKSTSKARRKWGLEDTRDMQRIEDEMDDEPILSAVLTASAARKPRGEDRNSKKEKTDTRKGEGRRRDEGGRRDPGTGGDPKPEPGRGVAPPVPSMADAATNTDPQPNPLLALIFGRYANVTISDILSLARRQGGSINLLDLVRKFVFGILPSLTVSLMLSTGDSLSLKALALLGSIVCEMAGLRVEVKFVSAACLSIVHGMMTQEGVMLPKLLTDLAKSAGNWPTAFEMIPEYAKSVIAGACNVGIEILVNLSVHFIVGFERIISIIDLGNSIQGKLVPMLCSNMRAASFENVFTRSALTILLAIACFVITVSIRRAFIASGGTAGITRRITSSLGASVASFRSSIRSIRRMNISRPVKMVLAITLGVGALLAGVNLGGPVIVTEQERSLLRIAMQVGTSTDTKVLSDSLRYYESAGWVHKNFHGVNDAATELLTNFSNTCPVPGNVSYIEHEPVSADSGQETEEPAQEPKDEQQNKGPEKKAPDVNGIFSILRTQIVRWHSSGPGDSTSCRPDTRWALVGELEATIKKCLVQLPGNKITLWANYEADVSTSNSTSSFLNELHGMAEEAPGPLQTMIGVIQEAARLIMKYAKDLSEDLDTAYSYLGDKNNEIKRPDVIRIMRLSDHEGSMPYLIDPVSGALARDSSGALVMYTDGMIDTEAKEIADGLLDVDWQLFINGVDPSRRVVIAQLVARLFGYKGAFTEACDVGPYEDLRAVLKGWEAAVDPPGIRQLEDATRGLFGRLKIKALPLLPWVSLPAMQQGLEILNTIAGPLQSEPVSTLLGYMSNATEFFKLRDDVLVKAMAKADIPPNERPDIVRIYSLIEQAQPNDKMPYKRTVSGVIERDNDRAPVKVSADAGPKGAEQDAIDELLVIDRAILDKQLDLSNDPTDHKKYEEHRYELAQFIALISGYKGPRLADSVTKTLYTLSLKVAPAKTSGDTAELRNGLKAFVEENKNEKGFKAFLPILKDKDPAEAIAPYNGPDLKLNAAHRAYEALREHTTAPPKARYNPGT